MALTNDALTTYEKVKSKLGISDAEDAAVQSDIEDIINAVSEEMAAIAGRKFYRGSWVENYRGLGDVFLHVHQSPLISVSQIRTIDIEGNTVEVFDTTSYRIDSAERGAIYRDVGFPLSSRLGDGIMSGPVDGIGPANIEVSYVGGWFTPKQYDDNNTQIRTLPYDLERAAIQAAIYVYQNDKKISAGGNPGSFIVSETSMGGSSVSYGQGSSSFASSVKAMATLVPESSALVALRYSRWWIG